MLKRMSTEGKHRLAAVWFADIVGYTDLASRDEKAALRVVDELQRLAREEVESRGGRIVKFIGDAALATFDSANTALESALALQEAFSESELAEEKNCALRIGLHLGEVVEADDGDIYGDGVNVASRIEGQAEAGQVVVSEDVHRALRQQAEHSFKPFGPVKLKGVEEPMWLYVVGAPEGAVPAVRADTVPESTALYNAVTKHWPKIALGSIGAAVGAGFAFGRIAGVSFQSYVFAWAATTAGIWFMFDKAEAAMSARSRKQVVSWLREVDLGPVVESIPAQFAFLFDRIFGEKHLSRQCFNRSSAASAFSVLVVWAVYIATVPVLDGTGAASEVAVLAQENGLLLLLIAGAVLGTMPFNFLPDYLSLLETRWTIGLMERTGRVGSILLLDFIATTIISAGGIAILFLIFTGLPDLILLLMGTPTGNTPVAAFRDFVQMALGVEDARYDTLGLPIRVSFLSAFFTSTWLWLYAASVPLSRRLLRLNNGVGFLLRVTDVERQPFRSMGFVSVIIVSVLFALGLPLVLL